MGKNYVSNSSRVSPQELKEAVKQVNNYFDSLKKIYVGRERTIDLIKFAILQKAHVLFFGVPGTAKTAIADSVFSGIINASKFEIQMTAFMGEDAVYGPYNVKKMREEGLLEHNTEKMLPDANFAAFDEFLDANPAVLRSLLSALNERRVIKGRQILDMPLHLAYCTSNIDPYVFMKRNPMAWAVFDRIAFIDSIDYLDKAEDITEMVKRFQYRISNLSRYTVEYEKILAVCDYVLMPPTLIQDQLIFQKFGEACLEYRKARLEKVRELEAEELGKKNGGEIKYDYSGIIFKEISDRRICWSSHMLEVNAVLNGRIQVIPEDMFEAHFILGTSEVEEKIWRKIVAKKIEEIKELKSSQLSDLQSQQYHHFRDQLNDLVNNGYDLETRVNGIATLSHQVEEVKPENDEVTKLYGSLLNDIDKFKKSVADELLSSKGLSDGGKK